MFYSPHIISLESTSTFWTKKDITGIHLPPLLKISWGFVFVILSAYMSFSYFPPLKHKANCQQAKLLSSKQSFQLPQYLHFYYIITTQHTIGS